MTSQTVLTVEKLIQILLSKNTKVNAEDAQKRKGLPQESLPQESLRE